MAEHITQQLHPTTVSGQCPSCYSEGYEDAVTEMGLDGIANVTAVGPLIEACQNIVTVARGDGPYTYVNEDDMDDLRAALARLAATPVPPHD